jgi:ferredoxin
MDDKVVTIGKYQVKVVRDLCISAATCVAVAPEVFELDAENKAIIKDGANDVEENVMLAAQSCPVKAIVIVDTATGQQIWPE